MREIIGDVGHLHVVIAFVASVVSSLAYFLTTRAALDEQKGWKNMARIAYYVHAYAVLMVVAVLFVIIYNHFYEYHYAWSHSSNHLPVHYMISCFWEGQEGSFLLWIFWHVGIGFILVRKSKQWESEVMSIFMAVQAFLLSMIIGIVIFNVKIGSSPFILLREVMLDAPIFLSNPDFVPIDGTGLNPLLQNYWMVIHPPTLFLGFALSIVPFVYAMAALWKEEYTAWIKPARVWLIVGTMVLGIGIMMGAYWAYETLNFGGYWNWDPVENAVYVPWLLMVAAIHTLFKPIGKKKMLQYAFVFVTLSFIFILYSTFLTRSGILGNASVHSFTDLGLSGQLLLYLTFFSVLAFAFIIIRWKKIPGEETATTWLDKEFWLFMGMAILSIAAFQVILGTSIPVFNTLKGLIGEKGKMAPPADQISFYTNFQIWMGVLVTIVGGIAQYIWWRKTDQGLMKKWSRTFSVVMTILVLVSTVIVLFSHYKFNVFQDSANALQGKQTSLKYTLKYVWSIIGYIMLLAGSLFALITGGILFKKIIKNNPRLTGGVIAHIGFALMMIGILFSSGYSNVLSINHTGLLYSREFSTEMNLENILLWRNDPVKMGDYEVVYVGQRLESPDIFGGFIDRSSLFLLDDESRKALVVKPIPQSKYGTGDTINVIPENTYYEIHYLKDGEKQFKLYPRAQVNPSMGLIASPDVRSEVFRDLYTHVSSIPDPDAEEKWSDTTMYQLSIGDTIFLNDYVAVLDSVRKTTRIPGVSLTESDLAIASYFSVLTATEDHQLKPVLLIKDGEGFAIPEVSEDLGIRISFRHIDPETGTFTYGVNTKAVDYIILKVVEKPLINLLWIGTLILSLGFAIAFIRTNKQA